MRILIAEDDAVSRKLLEARLQKMGHEVYAAVNGRQAFQLYRLYRPHIVITDWMMPHVDGLELCRMIRRDQRTYYAYLILLTVLNSKEHQIDGLNAGADDFLMKPADPDVIKARLRVAERVLSLQQDVTVLEGLLPVCSYCKRIRDDQENWRPVEEYVEEKTKASFSHAYCPECSRSLRGTA